MFEYIINFLIVHKVILISTVSLILSVYNFFYSLYSRQKEISVYIEDSRLVHIHNKYCCYLNLAICNKSQLPISIVKISINSIANSSFNSVLYFENTRKIGNTIISREETKTIQFPINLSNLESINGYVEFKSDKEINLENCYFSLFTNRGIIKKLSPLINNDSKN